jgi:hypothetical protein
LQGVPERSDANGKSELVPELLESEPSIVVHDGANRVFVLFVERDTAKNGRPSCDFLGGLVASMGNRRTNSYTLPLTLSRFYNRRE